MLTHQWCSRKKNQLKLARSAGEKKEESFPQITQVDAEIDSAKISEISGRKISRTVSRGLTQKKNQRGSAKSAGEKKKLILVIIRSIYQSQRPVFPGAVPFLQ